MAKPIIDILIVVDTLEQVQDAAEILRNCGYIVMSGNTSRFSLNKGYTENG